MSRQTTHPGWSWWSTMPFSIFHFTFYRQTTHPGWLWWSTMPTSNWMRLEASPLQLKVRRPGCASQCFTMLQNASKCFKMLQNASQCRCVLRNGAFPSFDIVSQESLGYVGMLPPTKDVLSLLSNCFSRGSTTLWSGVTRWSPNLHLLVSVFIN